jgi:hypothetical protein
VLSLYASWSESATDCFGSSCASESVWNLFLNATADNSSFCTWANARASRSKPAQTLFRFLFRASFVRLTTPTISQCKNLAVCAGPQSWTNVGGMQGVTFNADAFLAVLFAPNCTQSALSTAADQLVQINGGAPTQPIGVNVVELSAVDNVTDSSFSSYLCWTDPSFCSSTSTIVVNVFVNNFCKSGCIASSATAPTCYGASGCASTGQVRDRVEHSVCTPHVASSASRRTNALAMLVTLVLGVPQQQGAQHQFALRRDVCDVMCVCVL